ncbi:lethal(2)neighbour of tid protein 2-like [Ctenocephalides felis]|uniref:lethal(2)neighbour of tid protein 2-like n=1 Tax=Ctenocephalides felis TaxID=7515 RepID=UPI000E6E5A4F|nr:lethal(2)neighbour of tid protein 2-like [Ctenocephalides felis]
MYSKTKRKEAVASSKMKGYGNKVSTYLSFQFGKELLTSPEKLPIISFLILAVELVFNIFIINTRKYTEIDWIAYMQECEGFLNGTLDYSQLRGDTGPLVYPAGFVYIYSILYYITAAGKDIYVGQCIFIGIYLCQMALVLRLYTKSRKVPPYVLILCALTSYRIHSIYMLRLFNDPIAILFLYLSLNLYMDSKWTLASVALSLAVSIKMNILLFAPAIFLFLIVNLGLVKTIVQLSICGIIQLILGLPFLLVNAVAYIKGSFDFGRVFEHKWTVNYRFLHRDIFESGKFHISLLLLHLVLLAAFFPISFKYMQSYVRLRTVQKQFEPQINAKNKELKRKKINKLIEEEPLTAEQHKFLKDFEKGINKTSTPNNRAVTVEPKQDDNVKTFAVHFDSVTQLALLPIFLCNFIGVACSRSLHYQFYVWYFHSLPHLLWCTSYSIKVRLLILALIEYSWNTYPSTDLSSCVLHLCHVAVIWGIYKNIKLSAK